MNNHEVVTENLGIIARRALFYWKNLPASVRAYYDAEDMISDVTVRVVKVASGFLSSKAKSSTWVWYIADNECKAICYRFGRQKRSAVTVSLDEVLTEKTPSPEDQYRKLEAKVAVERVIEYASDDLRDYISDFFSRSLRRKPRPEVAAELRHLSRRHNACFRDFQLVYRSLPV